MVHVMPEFSRYVKPPTYPPQNRTFTPSIHLTKKQELPTPALLNRLIWAPSAVLTSGLPAFTLSCLGSVGRAYKRERVHAAENVDLEFWGVRTRNFDGHNSPRVRLREWA